MEDRHHDAALTKNVQNDKNIVKPFSNYILGIHSEIIDQIRNLLCHYIFQHSVPDSPRFYNSSYYKISAL